MTAPPPIPTRTHTLLPYTALFLASRRHRTASLPPPRLVHCRRKLAQPLPFRRLEEVRLGRHAEVGRRDPDQTHAPIAASHLLERLTEQRDRKSTRLNYSH